MAEAGSSHTQTQSDDDGVDLVELIGRLLQGVGQIAGLAAIGMVTAGVIFLAATPFRTASVTTRVAFTFPGATKGVYPDNSAFQPDDLRSPAVVAEALRRTGLEASSEVQSRIRGGLSIEGIVPANVTKERDRLRAAGQTLAPYAPDEFRVSLALPRRDALSPSQRKRLLNEIVSVYRENLRQRFGQASFIIGTAFDSLKDADYPEYEMVLNKEVADLQNLLKTRASEAPGFRSVGTNLSFDDLQQRLSLFSQIHLSQAVGMVHQYALTKNRETSLRKIDYSIRQTGERKAEAVEKEKVLREMLNDAESNTRSYVLGTTNPGNRQNGTGPVLSQGLVDSLLAGDPYNYLVRRALEAGATVHAIQGEERRLQHIRRNLADAAQNTAAAANIRNRADLALKELRSTYDQLATDIRRTYADYVEQQFGRAARLTDEVRIEGMLRSLATALVVGAAAGLAVGIGLSLLGAFGAGRTDSSS